MTSIFSSISFLIFLYLCLSFPHIRAQLLSRQFKSNSCPDVLPPPRRYNFSSELPQTRRIINGSPMFQIASPIVSIGTPDTDQILYKCTASLLSQYWVLILASCAFESSTDVVLIYFPSPTGISRRSFQAELSIIHPLYATSPTDVKIEYDIALIKLQDPAPANIPFFHINDNPLYPLDNSFTRIAGFGRTSFTISFGQGRDLHYVDLPVMSIAPCFPSTKSTTTLESLGNLFICVGYSNRACGPCVGDYGAPIYAFTADGTRVLHSIYYRSRCNSTEVMAISYRLTNFLSWMQSTDAQFTTSNVGVNVFRPGLLNNSSDSPSRSTPDVNGNVSTSSPFQLPLSSNTSQDDDPRLLRSASPSPSETAVVILRNPEVSPSSISPLSASPSSASSSATVPQDTGSQPACFPATAAVNMQDGSVKLMHELVIGDKVKVGHGKYSEVFFFTHSTKYGLFAFVELECKDCEKAIRLSGDHILPVNGELKAAKLVQVGDLIVKGCGKDSTVTRARYVMGRGIFNPHTMDGRIIVNGIEATTYTLAIEWNAAHAMLSPLRGLFRTFSRWAMILYSKEKVG